MRATLTVVTLPTGPMLTQYGVRAPITLDSESLSYPGNYGRPHGWSDAHIPRTERPVAFIPRAKGRARARIIRQGWDPNSFTIRL
jgi:hypothetical protein